MAPAAVTSSYEIAMGAYRSWSNHRAIRIGAGVAYYWLFALVPLAALAIYLAGAFFSVGDITEWVASAISVPPAAGQESQAEELVSAIVERSSSGGFGFVGAVAAAISASFAFAATQDAVNMVWDAPKRRGLRENAVRRVVLFVATVGFAALLIIGLIAVAVIGSLESRFSSTLLNYTLDVVSDVLVYAMAYLIVLAAYKYMPWPQLGWRPPMIASGITVLALVLATWGYGVYLSRTNPVSISGAAGSVLASLVWMYVLAQVFVAGAELTRAIHVRWSGSDPALSEDRPGGSVDDENPRQVAES